MQQYVSNFRLYNNEQWPLCVFGSTHSHRHHAAPSYIFLNICAENHQSDK